MADTLSSSIRVSADASSARSEFTALADAVDAANKRIVASSNQTSAQLEASVQKLTRQLDPLAAAQAKVAQGHDTINKAAAAGLVTSQERERLEGLLAQRFAATATRIEISRREVTSLSKALAEGRLSEVPVALSRIAAEALGLSGAVVGVVAAFVAIPAAAIAAADASERALNRIKAAIAASGNAGGQTPGSALALAGNLDRTTTLSYRGAQDVVTALIGSGRVTAGALPGAAALAPDLAAGMGVNPDQATKVLTDLLADPGKAAQQLVSQFNLLDDAQKRHIQDLAAQGRTEDAQRQIVEALTQRFKGLSQQSETLADRLGKWASDLWSVTLGSHLRPSSTIEEQQAALSPLLRGRAGGRGNSAAQSYAQQRNVMLGYQQYGESRTAADRAQDSIGNQVIESGLGAARQFDQVGARAEALAKAVDEIAAALKREADKADADPRSLSMLRLGAARAQTAKDNQLDPVQEELRRLAEQAAVSYAPIGQRAGLSAGNSIAAQQRANLAGGNFTPSEAQQVAAAQRAASAAALSQSGRDLIAETLKQGDAERQLVTAFGQSTAAAERQRLANEAAAAKRRDATIDEGAYAKALTASALASAQASSAATALNAQRQAAASARVAGAGGSPYAQAAARRGNQATDATQGEFDLADDPFTRALAEKHRQDILKALQSSSDSDRDAASSARDASDQRRLQVMQLELSLMGENAQARAVEVADLQLRNQLIEEGYKEGSTALDDEFNKRKSITEEIAKTNSLLEQAGKEDRQWQQGARQVANELGSDLERAATSGQSARQVFKGLEQDMTKLVFKLGVTNPLNNAIGSALPGSGTTGAPTLSGLFSHLFSGGGAIGGPAGMEMAADQAMPFNGNFAKGAAFAGGRRLRYYAAGDVFTVPTAFAMQDGIGIMGEKPPGEAAMPLVRGPDGSLGVKAHGLGGGRSVHYNIDARGADVGVHARLDAALKHIAAVDASVERRAISAVGAARQSGAL